MCVCICVSVRVCVQVTYVGVLVEKVQSVLIDSQDARGLEGGGARTLDVEEGGAKHGEGTDEAWRNTHRYMESKRRE